LTGLSGNYQALAKMLIDQDEDKYSPVKVVGGFHKILQVIQWAD
jgi:hypothetical protein